MSSVEILPQEMKGVKMTVCYRCNERFYGYKCYSCDWEAKYFCWYCKSELIPKNCEKCKECGWFECPKCDSCGCQEARPLSNEERRNPYIEESIYKNDSN